ncbi:hypothetical protein Syun_003293 [Stephania yunnanensis]|uniref:Uncharacterized protein n=1 Tax=Stephania yunnanensis TaxID=152371 RepID=A0AAP0L159_9MAGN
MSLVSPYISMLYSISHDSQAFRFEERMLRGKTRTPPQHMTSDCGPVKCGHIESMGEISWQFIWSNKVNMADQAITSRVGILKDKEAFPDFIKTHSYRTFN